MAVLWRRQKRVVFDSRADMGSGKKLTAPAARRENGDTRNLFLSHAAVSGAGFTCSANRRGQSGRAMTVNTLPSADLDLEVLLAHKETLADGVVRLVFRHPAGDRLPPWAPGAHVDLVLRPDLVRQYSLCGDPGDRSVLEVAVLREQAGRGGSEYVHD